jgi:hypothetical protein
MLSLSYKVMRRLLTTAPELNSIWDVVVTEASICVLELVLLIIWFLKSDMAVSGVEMLL